MIGLGKIGVLVANYARWKNMRVIAYEPYPNAANMHELSNKVEIADLDTVIAKSDFLTVHVPFIKGVTENLLNRKNLAGFKGSYIMNFARGGIVEMAPVNEMLASGSLQGYLCDFPDADLIKNDKVTCFPHLGASTEEAEENCAVMAVEELKDYEGLHRIRLRPQFRELPGPRRSPACRCQEPRRGHQPGRSEHDFRNHEGVRCRRH